MGVAGLLRVNTTRIVLATSFVGGQTPMILEVIYEDDLQRSDNRAV